VLASRGTRDLGEGEQPVDSPTEERALRRTATRIVVQAALLATAITAVLAVQ
jgi:hypothetical protein